jgi:hypothetical protein
MIARHKGPVRAGSRMESRNSGEFLGTLSESASTSVRFYIAGPSTPGRPDRPDATDLAGDRCPGFRTGATQFMLIAYLFDVHSPHDLFPSPPII